MGSSRSSKLGLASSSLASAMRICQPPLNSSRPARPILLAEAQAGEHAAHLRVERVAIERVKPVLQHGVSLGCSLVLRAFVIQFGQLPGEPLDLMLHFAQLVEDSQALFEHCTPRKLQALLWQVADTDAPRLVKRTVIERFQAGQDLHQCGFACAVGANQRGFFVVADEPVGLKKENPRAKSLAGIVAAKA